MISDTRYRVVHETRYNYSGPVSRSHQLAHLRPRSAPWQDVHAHAIEITPLPVERAEGVDFFGNPVLRFAVDQPHDELLVRAESVVTVRDHASQVQADGVAWESAWLDHGEVGRAVDLDVEQYRVGSDMAPLSELAADYARPSFAPRRGWYAALLDLTRRIHQDFVYDPKATTVTTRVADVLQHRRGVCQDFAHLMISCLRSFGLPARYVSGYVLNSGLGGSQRLMGADASHAWVAGYCPAYGWIAFDPTNAKPAGPEFVTLGWGRDFSDVTPLRGVVLGAAKQELSVAVSVRQVS